MKEYPFHVEEITAGENLTKGDVITLADGCKVDTGGNEYGPFGVALEDITSAAKGPVALGRSVVVATVDGTVSAFDMLVASSTTAGRVMTGTPGTDVYEEYVGYALAAIAATKAGAILLL